MICALADRLSFFTHSAKSFSSFLGGYSLFLGSIAGVLVTDYWVCRRQKLKIASLYDPRGIHYYTMGVNPRAIVAFVLGIVPNMPGLAAACGAEGVPKGATYLYSLSWLVSILVASFTYWSCWRIWPFPVDDCCEAVCVQGLEPHGDGSFVQDKEEEYAGGEKGLDSGRKSLSL